VILEGITGWEKKKSFLREYIEGRWAVDCAWKMLEFEMGLIAGSGVGAIDEARRFKVV